MFYLRGFQPPCTCCIMQREAPQPRRAYAYRQRRGAHRPPHRCRKRDTTTARLEYTIVVNPIPRFAGVSAKTHQNSGENFPVSLHGAGQIAGTTSPLMRANVVANGQHTQRNITKARGNYFIFSLYRF